MSAHDATRAFEDAVAKYTGAPYCVAVNSCTAALELCVARLMKPGEVITIPSRTYVSVPQVIVKHGGKLDFYENAWRGLYKLHPLPVYDCAKMFTRGLWWGEGYLCLSFHVAKVLGDTQGGAILCDNEEDAAWFRKARFDGRDASVPLCQDTQIIAKAFHCYMSPDVATRLFLKLESATFKGGHQNVKHEEEYCDLSQLECFKPYTV